MTRRPGTSRHPRVEPAAPAGTPAAARPWLFLGLGAVVLVLVGGSVAASLAGGRVSFELPPVPTFTVPPTDPLAGDGTGTRGSYPVSATEVMRCSAYRRTAPEPESYPLSTPPPRLTGSTMRWLATPFSST